MKKLNELVVEEISYWSSEKNMHVIRPENLAALLIKLGLKVSDVVEEKPN
jgi:hypothetical protein